jgi:hypothetical protein
MATDTETLCLILSFVNQDEWFAIASIVCRRWHRLVHTVMLDRRTCLRLTRRTPVRIARTMSTRTLRQIRPSVMSVSCDSIAEIDTVLNRLCVNTLQQTGSVPLIDLTLDHVLPSTTAPTYSRLLQLSELALFSSKLTRFAGIVLDHVVPLLNQSTYTVASITCLSGMADSCRRCGSTNKKLRECGQCRRYSYCSLKCQRLDWTSRHKWTCTQSSERHEHNTRLVSATASMLTSLANCTRLTSLSIGDCTMLKLSSTQLDFMLRNVGSTSHGLSKLALSRSTKLTDEMIRIIVLVHPELVHFQLIRCRRVTDQGLLHLSQLTQLKTLRLCRLTNTTPSSVGTLFEFLRHQQTLTHITWLLDPCPSKWLGRLLVAIKDRTNIDCVRVKFEHCLSFRNLVLSAALRRSNVVVDW